MNLFVVEMLRSVCAETPKRESSMIPVVEFALNNAVHASTGYTPFFVNGLTHPRVPFTLPLRSSGLGGGDMDDRLTDISPAIVHNRQASFSHRN